MGVFSNDEDLEAINRYLLDNRIPPNVRYKRIVVTFQPNSQTRRVHLVTDEPVAPEDQESGTALEID